MFLDKSVGIVIVEPTMSIAGTIRRVFLESGYSNVYIAHSVLDAFNTLSNNPVNWLIVSPLAEERLTQWHCLRLPLEVSAFSQIMVSVLVNPDQLHLTDEFYAYGALSVHTRQLTFNSFQEELQDLNVRLSAHPTVDGAIAADVRRRLQNKEDASRLERFEEIISTLVDESPQQKLRLIEARLKSHSNLEAMHEIQALSAKHPEISKSLKSLSETYLGTSDIQTFRGPIPVSQVLILDPDESQQQFMKTVFTELGSEWIQTAANTDEAIDALRIGKVYDVIVTEWKLGDSKGHAFIQHLRHHGHERQPVFIYSSLVKPEDHAIIEEISGVFLIAKPGAKKQVKQFISDTVERWNFPQKGDVQVDKVLNLLNAGRLKEAVILNEDLKANPKIDKKLKDLVKAHIAFQEGQYQVAKELILANAKSSVPGHKEISLLGKVLLKLGDAPAALKFLEQANQMVPGNVDRLCQLADANAGAGKGEKALELAKEAQKIGGDIDIVQSAVAKHTVAAGDADDAQQLLESEETARDVVAFMNNLGIVHASQQKWDESEQSYRKALKALDGRHPHLRALVAYNLGLSLGRQNRLSDALPLLKEAESLAEASLKRKVQDLRDRMEKAIATKQPLVLKEAMKEISTPRVGPPKTLLDDYQLKAKIKRHGLFGVLKSQRTIPGIDLTSELPRLVLRHEKGDGVEGEEKGKEKAKEIGEREKS